MQALARFRPSLRFMKISYVITAVHLVNTIIPNSRKGIVLMDYVNVHEYITEMYSFRPEHVSVHFWPGIFMVLMNRSTNFKSLLQNNDALLW